MISVHKIKKNPAIVFKAVNGNCLCVCSFIAVTRSGKTHFARSVSLVLTVASLAARVLQFSGSQTEGEPPATDIILLHISGRNTGNPKGTTPIAGRVSQSWGVINAGLLKWRRQLLLLLKRSLEKNAFKVTTEIFLSEDNLLKLAFAIERNLSLMKGRDGYSQMESTCLYNMKRQNNRKKLLHVMTVEFPAQLPSIFLTVCLIHIHITAL